MFVLPKSYGCCNNRPLNTTTTTDTNTTVVPHKRVIVKQAETNANECAQPPTQNDHRKGRV